MNDFGTMQILKSWAALFLFAVNFRTLEANPPVSVGNLPNLKPGGIQWTDEIVSKVVRQVSTPPDNALFLVDSVNSFADHSHSENFDPTRIDKKYSFTVSVLGGRYKIDGRAADSTDANLFHSIMAHDQDSHQSKVYDPVDDGTVQQFGRVHLGRNGTEHLFRFGYYFLGMEDNNEETFLESLLSKKEQWEVGLDSDSGMAAITLPIVAASDKQKIGLRLVGFDPQNDFRLIYDGRVVRPSGPDGEIVYYRRVQFDYPDPKEALNGFPGEINDLTWSKSMATRLSAGTVNIHRTEVKKIDFGLTSLSDVLLTFPESTLVSDNVGDYLFTADGHGGEIEGSRRSFGDDLASRSAPKQFSLLADGINSRSVVIAIIVASAGCFVIFRRINATKN